MIITDPHRKKFLNTGLFIKKHPLLIQGRQRHWNILEKLECLAKINRKKSGMKVGDDFQWKSYVKKGVIHETSISYSSYVPFLSGHLTDLKKYRQYPFITTLQFLAEGEGL